MIYVNMWLTLQQYMKDLMQLLTESTGIYNHVYRIMWLTAISDWKYRNLYLLYTNIRHFQQYVTDSTAIWDWLYGILRMYSIMSQT